MNTTATYPTEIELKWFAAVDAAEMANGNPLIALLGQRQTCDVLAFRARLKEPDTKSRPLRGPENRSARQAALRDVSSRR